MAPARVIAHSSFLTEGIREHADVVFPAEVYAEKEGTIVHPDGRLQRLRPAIARPRGVDAEWHVLCELARNSGWTSTCWPPRWPRGSCSIPCPSTAG